MMNTATDILSDESLQTQLFNQDAVDGLDEYVDDMREVEAVLSSDTGLSFRGAAGPLRAHSVWPQAMVLDLALALDSTEEILERYNIGESQWLLLQDNMAFRLELARARKEISESGLSFKRKAATQAEMYLVDMDDIMKEPDTTASLKHEIFKSMVKFGDLEPARKREEGVDGGSGLGGFNIQINF